MVAGLVPSASVWLEPVVVRDLTSEFNAALFNIFEDDDVVSSPASVSQGVQTDATLENMEVLEAPAAEMMMEYGFGLLSATYEARALHGLCRLRALRIELLKGSTPAQGIYSSCSFDVELLSGLAAGVSGDAPAESNEAGELYKEYDVTGCTDQSAVDDCACCFLALNSFLNGAVDFLSYMGESSLEVADIASFSSEIFRNSDDGSDDAYHDLCCGLGIQEVLNGFSKTVVKRACKQMREQSAPK